MFFALFYRALKAIQERTLNFPPLAFRCLVDASWCEGDNANLLASGSADGFVKVWDTRSAEGRPAASLFSMTAVSHVQWRRQSNHSLASTHGGDVRLWDIREGMCKRQRTRPLFLHFKSS